MISAGTKNIVTREERKGNAKDAKRSRLRR
jgi:hypothetical protein